jgi:lipid-binding SYLF domain-containing protein
MSLSRPLSLGVAVALIAATPAVLPQDQEKIERANRTIADFKHNDEGMTAWFDKAVGYAVFPNVGKGAIGIGGAHGTGILFEGGVATGSTDLKQLTIGIQFGGQSFAEVIFFEDEIALGNFKKGNFELAAQASAVAVTLGASADANYEKGVAVFTRAKGGLMYEAAVGGQKFEYKPW